MSEPRVRLPAFISWSALIGGAAIAISATWWQRGSVADQQALRESNASLVRQQETLAAEQRATNARVSEIEQAIREQKVDMRWIMEAIRRQELRSGHPPPPLPSP